jgi:D-glycerate 3-kinase
MAEDLNSRLADYIAGEATTRRSCLTVGLCGSQGSGKSTLAAAIKALLEARNITVAALSIDDLYLKREERLALAERIHPLLSTRGVPGTHDVALGIETLRALASPGIVAIPSFDKSRDDRRPRELWPAVRAPMQVVILEGWCVGAAPQEDSLLTEPVNALERDLDADGTWRHFVNRALAGEYQQLFARIDRLILLKAADFDVVYEWRLEQEHKLRQQVIAEGGDLSRVMSDQEVRTFIGHYERLTRHILDEMPGRADVVVQLDALRRPLAISFPNRDRPDRT